MNDEVLHDDHGTSDHGASEHGTSDHGTSDHRTELDSTNDVQTSRVRRDGSTWFAWGSLALAGVALVVVGIVALTDSGGSPDSPAGEESATNVDDGAVGDPDADADAVLAASAVAMGEVTSVEFALDQSGAPVYIDEFQSIALSSLVGQFTVPGEAAAVIDVVVDGSLNTRIGAVALDDEIWISNPVTGTFETLPAGYDIDPSKFFDPTGGWQPLLERLTGVELVGVEDDGSGDRYHLSGTAPPSEVTNITVGLVRDQEVPVDLWIHPTTSLVTRAEFTTVIDDGESTWRLDLGKYGDAFVIERPEGVDQ